MLKESQGFAFPELTCELGHTIPWKGGWGRGEGGFLNFFFLIARGQSRSVQRNESQGPTQELRNNRQSCEINFNNKQRCFKLISLDNLVATH